MLILIDTSGCPGFKLIKNSTPFLVIGTVVFKNLTEAEKTSHSITVLKQTLSIQPEFKFNKTNLKAKEIFFNEICPFDFDVRILIADKVGIDVPALKANATRFYDYLVRTFLENNTDILPDSSIKINQHMDRRLKKILISYLNKQSQIKKFRFSYSKTDTLIQLADMITGIVAKTFTDDSLEAEQLFKILTEHNKIKSFWKLREA